MNTATYSPEDDKLRVYTVSRLDKPTYERVRAKGFRYAPHQELFFAVWTPEAEDIALELAEYIDDEDKSLSERAEERSDRFEQYSENRTKDAEQARAAVHAIADNIPLGQPILIGHHSEKHARRDAKRIENGMRKAVKMWETAEYWQDRAASAIRHAKYKERPDVRARRIKGLESDERKFSRELEEAADRRRRWEALGDEPDREKALAVANYGSDHSYCAWSDLEYNRKTPAEVRAGVLAGFDRYVPRYERWLAHTRNRLNYERAMLAASGGIETDKSKPEVGGGVICWASPGRFSNTRGYSWIKKVNKVSVTVEDNWHNPNDATGGRNFTRTIPFDKCAKVISRAEVEKARAENRFVETSDKVGFYITSDFPAETPEPETKAPEPAPEPAAPFEAMRETLKAGIQIAAVNQLFPTPLDLAARMVELLAVRPGDDVLEPSAGTGRLLHALTHCGNWFCIHVTAVECNLNLVDKLRETFDCVNVLGADFLLTGGKFDKIIMNPPFENGSDIKHIRHAMTQIRPGGRIVAICANGPRQQTALKPLAEGSGGIWEELPEGTFAGTGVRAVLAVFNEGPEASR